MVKSRRPFAQKNLQKALERTCLRKKDLKVRSKKAPRTTTKSLKMRKAVKTYRSQRGKEGQQITGAIEVALDRMNAIALGSPRIQRCRSRGLRQREPTVLALRPPNFDTLVNLISGPERVRPSAPGPVIFVPHTFEKVKEWIRAECVYVGRHVKAETLWVVVRKPWPLKEHESPFLALDSTNCFVAPPCVEQAAGILPNRGLYVIYNKVLNEYYVGTSDNIERRLDEHRRLLGSEWTKRWSGDFVRVSPLKKYPHTYSWSKQERLEVLEIAKRKFRCDGTHVVSEGTRAHVRGGGFSLSQ